MCAQVMVRNITLAPLITGTGSFFPSHRFYLDETRSIPTFGHKDALLSPSHTNCFVFPLRRVEPAKIDASQVSQCRFQIEFGTEPPTDPQWSALSRFLPPTMTREYSFVITTPKVSLSWSSPDSLLTSRLDHLRDCFADSALCTSWCGIPLQL